MIKPAIVSAIIASAIVAAAFAGPEVEPEVTLISPDKLVPVVQCLDENGLPYATIPNPLLQPPSLMAPGAC